MAHFSSPGGSALAQTEVFAHLLGRVEGWSGRLPAPPSSLTQSWHDHMGDPGTDKGGDPTETQGKQTALKATEKSPCWVKKN